MEEWQRTLFRPVIEAYVDSIVSRGRCELNREVLLQFPVTILHAMMGLPEEPEGIDRFHHLAQSLFLVRGPNPEEGIAAASELAGFFDEIVANHRAGIDTGVAADGIVSRIISANDEVGVLTDGEITGFLRFLLPAGAETTTKSSGNLLIGLLQAGQWDDLVADPTLVNAATEEGLRWETSAPTVFRVTKKEVEVGGTTIPAGAGINAVVTSANRDEKRFAEPDRFDIHRSDGGHVGLGFGIHLCLGHQMARLEIRTLLDVLVRKMPRLRLDDEAEPPSIHGLTLRFPDRVPVRWD
jgi:cytochrome P450